jgi:nitroreductase
MQKYNLQNKHKMDKSAVTQYPVLEVIRKRWSVRAFDEKPIAEETLHQFFEAASWAPSSMNEQPWLYYYAHKANTEKFSQMINCLMPANQTWAKDAAVIILAAVRTKFENGHQVGQINKYAYYDIGAANTNLMLDAAQNNVFGHTMGGFHHDLARALFHLPEDIEPVVFMALGYPGDPESLPENLRHREGATRSRKPVSGFIFPQK